jgi:hypothetical protein
MAINHADKAWDNFIKNSPHEFDSWDPASRVDYYAPEAYKALNLEPEVWTYDSNKPTNLDIGMLKI